MRRRDRALAAALYAAAAAGAAATHVAAETEGALRDWRQSLPLAVAVGAAFGWFMLAPRLEEGAMQAARVGGAVAVAGMLAFALVFAAGHGLIAGSAAAAGDALSAMLSDFVGPTGVAAIGLGAAAGWIAGKLAPSRR